MLPEVPREALIEAMERFDRELRDTSEWAGWEDKLHHKYAIEYEGRIYPVKQIISMATGKPVSDFSGGDESSSYLRKKGFAVAMLRDENTIKPEDESPEEKSREPSPGQIRYWQIAPAENARLWDDLFNNSIAAVGYSRMDFDLSGYSEAELMDLFKKQHLEFSEMKLKINFRHLWHFRNLKPGDKIVTNKGKTLLLGIGVVKGGYKFRPERNEYKHTVDVKYYQVSKAGIPVPEEFKGKLGRTIVPLKKSEFEALESLFPSDDKRSWIFQANPKHYDLDASLKVLKEQQWLVNQHRDKLQIGDTIYLWQAGPDAGILAVAEALSEPEEMSEDERGKPFVKSAEKFIGIATRVRLKINQVLEEPILGKYLKEHPILSTLTILKMPYQTNYPLTSEQAVALRSMISKESVYHEVNVWWVNQGWTLREEEEGGFLWAPLRTKKGRTIYHWDTMAEVRINDIILHYANGALRYVSRVIEPAVEAPKPSSMKEQPWEEEGRLVKVYYHELNPPIPLAKFSQDVLEHNIMHGPINTTGRVNQGYLFRFTPHALRTIQESQPETTWPDFAILVELPTPEVKPVLNPEYPLSKCAEETGFSEELLPRWVRAIERKGQAIFYGPPGTGKTYIAERLARHLIGGGDGFTEIVQFHPAYAYEDFVQGIRPQARDGGGLDYPVVPGRFLEFCGKSRQRQDRCVLIIDEINRANLARVFGELMYLLEYRNRDVPLASGGSFQIPVNVRMIGTMNTADRSIALVDHALRRRFAFLALYPDYDILQSYHLETGFVVDGLVQTLRRLNTQIADPHYEVGITFFLRDDLHEQIEDIWRMEIEPYLEEYFFDQPEKVDEFRWDKIRDKILL